MIASTDRFDLAGRRFGRLVAVEVDDDPGRKSSPLWLCKCDCGNHTYVTRSQLMNRRSPRKSCGCRRRFRSTDEAGKRQVLRGYRQGARTRGLLWQLTDTQAERLFKSVCEYCGNPPSNEARPKRGAAYIYNGIDRKDNKQGYLPSNVAPCCAICNKRKGTLSKEEYLAVNAQVTDYQRSKQRATEY